MKYDNPSLDCDIVMKGGITSGVVYPSAVCRLAETFKFRSVGGTSAGAIAAAATAAAEHGRTIGCSDSAGFRQLEALPQWLSADTNLFDLFQPAPATRRIFAFGVAFLGPANPHVKAIRCVLAALTIFWPASIVGLVLDATLWALVRRDNPGFLEWLCFIVVSVAILALCIAWLAWHDVRSGLTGNGFGLCNGLDQLLGKPKPLTAWLADLLDTIAGIPANSGPLTFGDLWNPNVSGERPQTAADVLSYAELPPLNPTQTMSADETGRAINLQMMTSCVTLGQPFVMPFSQRLFFFDPVLAAKYFPPRIVDWMVSHPPAPRTQKEALERELLKPLLPLPAARDFPVVIAVRMSLSFPILLSAVPLHAIDWGRRDNQNAEVAVVKFAQSHGNAALDTLRSMNSHDRAAAGLTIAAEKCWFSDGGIAHNFPVHFFDTPLPLRPTFAIDLDAFSIDTGPESRDESRNVWMPHANFGGSLSAWNRFEQADQRVRLLGFLAAIFDTMQNWVDNAQARTPGYRDRIAHVLLSAAEGGLNLTMPRSVLAKLTARGLAAANLFLDRFANPKSTAATTWVNHRWVRYRSFMAMIEPLIKSFGEAFNKGDPSYSTLANCSGTIDLPSYQWKNGDQCAYAGELANVVLRASEAASHSNDSLADGAPRPLPDLVARPNL